MNHDNENIRIMIVDGSVTENLQIGLLLSNFEELHIVHEARTGEDAIAQCTKHQPDIVIINSGVRDMSEISLISEIMRICPLCQCIVLTTSDEPQWSAEVMRAGGRYIVSKPIEAASFRLLITGAYDALVRYKNSIDNK